MSNTSVHCDIHLSILARVASVHLNVPNWKVLLALGKTDRPTSAAEITEATGTPYNAKTCQWLIDDGLFKRSPFAHQRSSGKLYEITDKGKEILNYISSGKVQA